MFCSKCGKEVPDTVEFCPYCGTKNILSGDGMGSTQYSSESSASYASERVPYTPFDNNPIENGESTLESVKSIVGGIVGVIAVIAIIIFVVIPWLKGKPDQYYIDIVKSGTFDDYPDYTIGDKFDSFFTNTSWEHQKENGIDYVIFRGDGKYFGLDEASNVCMYFKITETNDDTATFEASRFILEGEDQPLDTLWYYVGKVFNTKDS